MITEEQTQPADLHVAPAAGVTESNRSASTKRLPPEQPSPPKAETTFASLNLADPILRAVTEAGYVKPTPIQAQAIPVVMAGLDVMGGAQTGTGKTTPFTLPILNRMLKQPILARPHRHPSARLMLAPRANANSDRGIGRDLRQTHTGLRSTVVFGGVDIKEQKVWFAESVAIARPPA